jgi:outer membrane protein OmpA-like peptidoglycan-associated protein
MPLIRTRDTVILIGTAVGIAAGGGSVSAEPRTAGASMEARIILAQNQPQEEEERRKRREQRQEQRGQDGGNQGGGQERRGRQGGDDGQQNQQRQRVQQDDNRGQQGGDREERRRQRPEQTQDNQQNQQRQRVQQDDDKNQQGGGQGERRRQQNDQNDRAERGRQQQEEQNKRERAQQEEQNKRAQQQQDEQKKRERAVQEQQDRNQRARQQEDDRKDRDRADKNDDGRNRERTGGDDRRGPAAGGSGQDRAGQDGDGDRRRSRADRREQDAGERLRDGVISREEQQDRRRERKEFSRENLKDITRQRRERKEEGGRIVIEEPDKRRIVRDKGRAIIRHDETERLRGYGRDVKVERDGGRNRVIIDRPDGVKIISIQDEDGRLVRRIKRLRNGREIILINNDFEGRRNRRDRDRDRYRDRPDFYVELPEIVINAERRDYYVDADESSEDEIEEALSAEPIEDIEGDYTLDEIRYNSGFRKRLRRVHMDSINFEFGSWEVRSDQVVNLQEVASAIKRILRRNPDEVFLIGGYTDAVGSDEDNLSLSDRRAETVARVLTDEFGVPPENLVTQGYGEQDLLIQTEKAEVRNRRVEFMRITPFLAQKDE